MIAFAWQSMLLLGLAYVLGCWIGCLARRMISTSAEIETSEAIPAGAIASAAAAGTVVRPSPAPFPPPRHATLPAAVPVRDAFRRADTLEPQPEPAPRQPSQRPTQPPSSSRDSVARFERALGGSQAGSATFQSPPAPAQITTPPAGHRPLPGQASGPSDDLKRIRSIDEGVEAALHRIGVRTFAEIGAWKPADVARVSHALGVKGRIEQQNWIEQAQILASGRETH
jgi:predicted flap endonuclease-1-like 5' DNA nuclease